MFVGSTFLVPILTDRLMSAGLHFGVPRFCWTLFNRLRFASTMQVDEGSLNFLLQVSSFTVFFHKLSRGCFKLYYPDTVASAFFS